MQRLMFIAVTLLVPSLALAGGNNYRKQLRDIVDTLDDAEDAARDSRGQCRRSVADEIGKALDAVDDLRERHGREASDADIFRVRQQVAQLGVQAPYHRCPQQVTEKLVRATNQLDELRATLWNRQGPQAPAQDFTMLAPLKVQPNSNFDREKAVKVMVPDLRLNGMQGRTFYLAARFRSLEGRWSEWVTTQQWTVPSSPFTWKNPFNHFFRYSTLAEEDFSNGRFVAQVSVFDGQGNVLATREAMFMVRLPKLPPASPPVVVGPNYPPGYQPPPGQYPPGYQPPPGQPPPPTRPGTHQAVPVNPGPPPVAFRDCGTGRDPGCEMTRNNLMPMDAPTFAGLITSMRSNSNELSRRDIFVAVMKTNGITALQLGQVLDHFANEITRLDVARFAAPRTVNPSHALGFAAKWKNNLLGRDYTTLMASQR